VSRRGRRGDRGPGPEHAREVARQKLAQQRAAQRRRSTITVAAIVAVVLLVAGGIGIAVYNAQSKPAANAAVPRGGDAAGIVVGRPDAKVTVDVYLDFLCPGCRQFEDTTGPTLDRFVAAGTVKIYYHPVAFLDRLSAGTRYSTRSAAAAACAADAGVFPQYLRVLYAHQPTEGSPGHTDDELIALGRQAGATAPAFAECVRQKRYVGWVAGVTDRASKAGVDVTPTVLVDGRQLPAPTPDALTTAVEAAAGK
jgi:protein-disulfide isomerase